MSYRGGVMEASDASFALTLHRYLVRLTSSATSIYIWIIVFVSLTAAGASVGSAITQSLLLFALAQTITILLLPLVLKLTGGNILRGLVFGTLAGIASLVYVGAFASGVFPHGTAAIGILLGAYHALYRAPYELEHRVLSVGHRQSIAGEFLLAVAPLLSGLCIVFAQSYSVVLFGAAALQFVALLPLLYVFNVREDYSWSYRETFAQLAEKRNSALVWSAMQKGVGGALLFLLGPLAVFVWLKLSPLGLGAIFAGTLLVILAIKSKPDHMLFDQRADNATYVDEYTVLKEIALAGGRLLVSLVVAVVIAMFL